MKRTFLLLALTLYACGIDPEGADETRAALGDAADESAVTEALGQEVHRHQGPLIAQTNDFTKWVYTRQSREWLRWMMKLPWSTGPVADETGAACAQGQQGPVWLLAGTIGGPVARECTIPRGKFLYFPLVNNWVTPPREEVKTPEGFKEWQDIAYDWLPQSRRETCTLELKLDGQSLGTKEQLDSRLWVGDLNSFPFEMNADNVYEPPFAPGRYRHAWLNGHFALLRPLSRGDHTLELGGTLCDRDGEYFMTRAVYTLHVR